jgi:hypothetical protein
MRVACCLLLDDVDMMMHDAVVVVVVWRVWCSSGVCECECGRRVACHWLSAVRTSS